MSTLKETYILLAKIKIRRLDLLFYKVLKIISPHVARKYKIILENRMNKLSIHVLKKK